VVLCVGWIEDRPSNKGIAVVSGKWAQGEVGGRAQLRSLLICETAIYIFCSPLRKLGL
jgi:hypothetical protein